jgi:hypothetical protein
MAPVLTNSALCSSNHSSNAKRSVPRKIMRGPCAESVKTGNPSLGSALVLQKSASRSSNIRITSDV